MTQQEQQCAYCHAILFEEDDVVYCPECGAPHHRECYNKLGECANKAMHGQQTEQDYQEPQQQSEQEPRPQGVPLDRDGHVCEKCGKRSTSDTLFCPYCGAGFVKPGEQRDPFNANRYAATIPGFDPYGGVDPSSELDGHPVSEVASFVRVNTNHYIPVFVALRDRNRKTGWNWAAFLLTYVWLFFRKCYREGFVVVLFSVLATLLQAPWSVSFYNYMSANNLTVNDLLRQTPQATEQIFDMAQSIPLFAWALYLVGIGITVGVHLIVARYGNHLYRSRVSKRISQIKADERITDKASAIASAGGCNIFSAAAIMYGMNLLSNLILNYFIS